MRKGLVAVQLALLVIFALPVQYAAAQIITSSTKPHPAVDMQRLARVDELVNSYISKNWLTGAVTLVIKDNQVVQYKGYGVADVSSGKRMEKDAIFRIMSQTKAITSVGVMILYEQGKFLLDESIGNFIPAFKNPTVLEKFEKADSSYTTVPAKRDITFRDLLTHTSGIDYADIGSAEMKAIYAKAGVPSGLGFFRASLLDKMNVLAKLPLKAQPGEKFIYGLNTDLLGCLIEVISGNTLDVFFKKNIFEPLGMKDTYFNVPKEKASRLAGVYTEDAQHKIIKWSPTFRNIDPDYPLMNTSYFSGGAGLSSTAFDYAIFLQALLNGGKYNGYQLLGARTVQLMTSGQLDFKLNPNEDNFGLGFQVTSEKSAAKSGRNKGSFAWGGYYGTTYWVDPKAGLVCLFLTQQNPNSHGDIGTRFENIVYSSLK